MRLFGCCCCCVFFFCEFLFCFFVLFNEHSFTFYNMYCILSLVSVNFVSLLLHLHPSPGSSIYYWSELGAHKSPDFLLPLTYILFLDVTLHCDWYVQLMYVNKEIFIVIIFIVKMCILTLIKGWLSKISARWYAAISLVIYWRLNMQSRAYGKYAAESKFVPISKCFLGQ